MSKVKPSLVIGGASKSGTTALYYYLRQHPDICLSEKKELHFFSRAWLEQSVAGPGGRYVLAEIPETFEEYLSFFSHCDQAKVAVDISPSYLFYYRSAEQIKKYLGDVSVVFVLRNPVDKAFSQYLHLIGVGRETLNFEDALAEEPFRDAQGYPDMWLYKKSGFYADAIKHYKEVFGDERVKVFYYDDFVKEPNIVLHEICMFAGLEDGFDFVPVPDVNRSGLPKSHLVAKLIAPNVFTYLLRRVVPQGLGRVARKLLKDLNAGEKPKLSDETRSSLMSDFAEDIQEIELLVGRKSGWLA
jgi:hypothetical protein